MNTTLRNLCFVSCGNLYKIPFYLQGEDESDEDDESDESEEETPKKVAYFSVFLSIFSFFFGNDDLLTLCGSIILL